MLVTVFLGLYCRYIGHSIFSYFCTADIIVTAYISLSVLQISWSMCSLWDALRASGAAEKYIGEPTFMLSHAWCCKFTTLLHIIHHHTLRLAVASHSSPRTLRSSALHVSHDSWALSDPHVSSPARCEAVSEPLMARRLRGWKPRHDRQLGTPASFMSSDRMKRSMFGLCRCYNLLPQELVSLPYVKLLQRHLQMGLRRCAQTGSEDWHELLSQKWSRLPRQDFHALFS